jgi:hypothetical protein
MSPPTPLLESGELELRQLLWLRHGCPITALYGDDGEMQCNRCRIDFKRDSAADILARFERINLDTLKNTRPTPPIESPAKCPRCGTEGKHICLPDGSMPMKPMPLSECQEPSPVELEGVAEKYAKKISQQCYIASRQCLSPDTPSPATILPLLVEALTSVTTPLKEEIERQEYRLKFFGWNPKKQTGDEFLSDLNGHIETLRANCADLKIENDELFKFINSEMKMTGSDPRIDKLEQSIKSAIASTTKKEKGA